MKKVYIVTVETTKYYQTELWNEYSYSCDRPVTRTEIVAAATTKRKGLTIGREILEDRLVKFLVKVAGYDSFESPMFKKDISPDHALVVFDSDYYDAIDLKLIVKPLKVV